MGKVIVDQVLAEAKPSSRNEQQQLWDTLDAWLWPEHLEEQRKRMLYEAGLLHETHPPGAATVSSPRCSPVNVSGPPVSETLIDKWRSISAIVALLSSIMCRNGCSP
jgi:hypothetical protein